jgi:hypothetical protein
VVVAVVVVPVVVPPAAGGAVPVDVEVVWLATLVVLPRVAKAPMMRSRTMMPRMMSHHGMSVVPAVEVVPVEPVEPVVPVFPLVSAVG